MWYLLKEALKTICGVKQWDYAVFWKIGCHNPKLLIWEECYYEPPPCIIPQASQVETNQVTSGGEWEGCLAPMPRLHALEKVQLLVDGMMIKNQIIMMGEGIIGRAAFTGNHQWILSGSLSRDSYPPEVLSQLHHQFSAGMQTIAVIPVKPHGLVQLGSSLALMENVGFVDKVKSLILQLGVVPGALLSDNYLARDAVAPFVPMPPCGMSRTYDCMNPNDLAGGSPSSGLVVSHLGHVCDTRTANRKMGNDVAQATAISPESRPGAIFQSVPGLSDVNGDYDTATVQKKRLSSDDYSWMSNKFIPPQPSVDGSVAFDVQKFLETAPLLEGIQLFNGMDRLSTPSLILDKGASPFIKMDDTGFMEDLVHLEGIPLLRVNNPMNNTIDIRTCSSVPSKMDGGGLKGALKSELGNSSSKEQTLGWGMVSEQCDSGNYSTISTNLKCEEESFAYEDMRGRIPLGDDLFDILGRDYKQRILSTHLEKAIPNESDVRPEKWDRHAWNHGKTAETFSDYFPMRDGMSESCAFKGPRADDNLLDAIVSGSSSRQCSDDNVSSKTTLTKASCYSVPSSSLTYTHFGHNGTKLNGGSFEFARPLEKPAVSVSCSDVSGHSKERTCSWSNDSLCGSQISSWVEQCHIMKRENSVPSGYSKRPGSGETMKPHRKRLKPGENPRPRPKDRQMIQDRLKELRELVPSGAKCSIDALLERTIKHMLFLQSVTKHADKLKLTGESKIRDKEGGLLLKDNFEGSQSMICPIIVEDLNRPRQMLVEMLCQERGLFLEIADAIQGLGLTILNGVMEACDDDKIWAQFAVEANRDVTQMEIFMSLVHLLEKTGKSSPGSTNALESGQTVHHSSAAGMPTGI